MLEANAENEDRVMLLTQALPETVAIFQKLDDEGRSRLLSTISTLFGIGSLTQRLESGPVTSTFGEASERFTKEQSLSPKEFLLKKQPRSDIERIACLAYYLAYYREQVHFKTLDISKLNTEAAQTKLSNAARSVDHATQYGYLAQAVKGMKQISAAGEKYVDALPDREAAKAAFANARPKRTARKKKGNSNGRAATL